MISMMAEAAEAPMMTDMSERVLKILAGTRTNLDRAAGELNLMDSEALIISS